MANNIMNKNIIIGVVTILVIGVVGFNLIGKKSTEEEGTQGQRVMNPAGTMQMIVGDNALYVSEQKPGTTMLAQLVMIEDKGYVVIHESDNGKPGKIVGTSRLLEKGQTMDVSITLSAPLVDGKMYIAMLHVDNGDGVFNGATDAPAQNEEVDASPIMMEFGVSVNASDAGIIAI